MFIRRPITRFQLSRMSQRIINAINPEAIFQPTQIQTWRALATDDPCRALQDIGKAITDLRIECLKDYTFDLKTIDKNKETEKDA